MIKKTMNAALNQKSVVIIAGETSGDLHGAQLVRAMKKKDPSLFFSGIGGPELKTAGVEILMNAAELSVVGITEVFSKMSKVVKGISSVKNVLRERRPGLIILIDFPDFNLHIATIAKKHGVPVLYYISPQIWAWRSGRIRKIEKNVDHMAVILPFEKDFYRSHNVPATFVGHPLLDSYSPLPDDPLKDATDSIPVVGLLPGSRYSEIERNLPFMLAAASVLQNRFKNICFMISIAPSISKEKIESFVKPYKKTCCIELISGSVVEIFKKSRLIVAASGTVTLETAIYGVPMVIMYKISPISYMLGQALVNVEHIGLVNIIANERIVPELIQGDATPAKIAETVGDILYDPKELARIKEKLKSVKAFLGSAGAAEKTADIGLALLKAGDSS